MQTFLAVLCFAAVTCCTPTGHPTPISTSPVPTTSLNASMPDITCSSGPRYLYTPDCWGAINMFPYDKRGDPNPATFSKDPADPRWKLPSSMLYGSCLAIVELGLLPEEYSTWEAIRGQLAKVYKKCVVNEGIGGYSSLGELGGIRVSLQPMRAPPPPLTLSNGPPEVGQVQTS